MTKGKLDNGFEYEIDENILNDMELLDAIAETQYEDPLKISTVCKKVLGVEQRNRLYEFVRAEDGTVPVDAVTQTVVDIMMSLGDEGKNS